MNHAKTNYLRGREKIRSLSHQEILLLGSYFKEAASSGSAASKAKIDRAVINSFDDPIVVNDYTVSVVSV